MNALSTYNDDKKTASIIPPELSPQYVPCPMYPPGYPSSHLVQFYDNFVKDIKVNCVVTAR